MPAHQLLLKPADSRFLYLEHYDPHYGEFGSNKEILSWTDCNSGG